MARAVKMEGGDATLLVRVHSVTIYAAAWLCYSSEWPDACHGIIARRLQFVRVGYNTNFTAS